MATRSSEEFQPGIKIYLNHPWNLIQSGFLVLTWFALACHLELIGLTMPILVKNTKIDYNGMDSELIFRSIGYFVINISGGILQNIVKKHSECLLLCAFILPTIVVIAAPFVKSFILLRILYFFQGTSHGLTDLGGTNIILTLWGANAAAPLNTAHLGYGIGAVFINLLVRPFVTEQNSSMNITQTNSNIVIPYSITKILCISIAIVHAAFCIQEQKDQRQKLDVQQTESAAVSTNPENVSQLIDKDKSSPYSLATCGQYGLIFLTIFIFYIFFIGAINQAFSRSFLNYLKFKKINLSTEAASLGIIFYWLSYSIGQLIGAIVSVFQLVNVCLVILWFIGFSLAIGWVIFGLFFDITSTGLFILDFLASLIFSPIIPLSFCFNNQRLNVVPMRLGLLLCGKAFGAIAFQNIADFVMNRNPNYFLLLLIICVSMSFILFIASSCYIYQQKNSLNTQPSVTNDAALSPEGLNDEEQQTTAV